MTPGTKGKFVIGGELFIGAGNLLGKAFQEDHKGKGKARSAGGGKPVLRAVSIQAATPPYKRKSCGKGPKKKEKAFFGEKEEYPSPEGKAPSFLGCSLPNGKGGTGGNVN